jgi:hypothetical protein
MDKAIAVIINPNRKNGRPIFHMLMPIAFMADISYSVDKRTINTTQAITIARGSVTDKNCGSR